jgi:ATP-dependent Clp protease ATP-binding subunit ClpC
MGFSLEQGRLEVQKIIGRPGDPVLTNIPFTPRAKKLLACGRLEADKLESKDFNSEHILLGLISEANISLNEQEPGGVAFQVLQILDVDLEHLRTKVLDLIKTNKKPQ